MSIVSGSEDSLRKCEFSRPTMGVLGSRDKGQDGVEGEEEEREKCSGALIGNPRETRSQLLAEAQHQSMADTEPGLEPGPYAASRMASSQIPNLAWPRAERVRNGEKNCMWGPQIMERRKKQGLTAQICTATRKPKVLDSFKSWFLICSLRK